MNLDTCVELNVDHILMISSPMSVELSIKFTSCKLKTVTRQQNKFKRNKITRNHQRFILQFFITETKYT